MTATALFTIADMRVVPSLFGAGDRNLRLIRETYGVQLTARNDTIRLKGEPSSVTAAEAALRRLQDAASGGKLTGDVARNLVLESAPVNSTGRGGAFDGLPDRLRAKLRPRTAGQAAYLESMQRRDVVFAVGPAGTGKTFLAVAMAVSALRTGRVRRIVLVRPAVEAGEKLGFLPGDFQAKINPYLRPLYDALGQLLARKELDRLYEKDQIEIVPLAYMRGRTLEDAFIIMDEAQNTTPAQMKMFLTRLGLRSRIVVTGDPTQVDLPAGQSSGLGHARDVLRNVDGIAFVELTQKDIVRHSLVTRIVDAYEHRTARLFDDTSDIVEVVSGRHALPADEPAPDTE